MFAIAILNIKEIIEYGNLTEVPMVPSFIRGVINLRGSVVPVVDLSVRFGRKRTEVSRRTCIVIIEVQSSDEAKQDIGVMVDSVSEVLEIPRSEIEPPPAFGAKIRVDFMHGMGKVAGKFVIILDADKVLSVESYPCWDNGWNCAGRAGGCGCLKGFQYRSEFERGVDHS
jgi:purine-binding chemotaxis protein CheW